MPVSPTYPGVYVQEVPSGVRTIVGVGTSTALFIGRTQTGPMLRAVRLTTYSDFVRTFGDDGGAVSAVARYVRLFFLNGGTDCYVIRIANAAVQSSVTLRNVANTADSIQLRAKNPGALGDYVRIGVNYNTAQPEATFNLEIFRWDISPGGSKKKTDQETFLNLSMDPKSPSFVETALNQKSKLVEVPTGTTTPTAQQGFSASTVPIEAPDASFRDQVVNTWLTPPAGTQARNKFKVSIGGKKYVTATVLPFAAGGSITDARNNFAAAIQNAIQKAVQDEGVTGLPTPPATAIAFEGPATGGATHTTLVRIRAANNGDDANVISADSNDLAGLLGLGTANGGIEVGAYANARPAPTGITYKPSAGLEATPPTATAALLGFGSTLHNALNRIVLDELDPTGALINNPGSNIIVTLPGGATQIWRDSTGGGAGVVEALGDIRDAVNAYQAANPTTFLWKAELWGQRLALIDSGGDDNAVVAGLGLQFGGSGTVPADMLARFIPNVRYYQLGKNGTGTFQTVGNAGYDGDPPQASDYEDAYAIAHSDIDLFNLLVLPPDAKPAPGAELKDLWADASVVCNTERAFLIMDPPDGWDDSQSASTGVNALRPGLIKDHSAVYFPRLTIVENGRAYTVGPAGAMAGLYARIDSARGVWKAPAGSEADVRGVTGIDVNMSDLQNGQMNPVGVNAIRLFPEGVISWGARTMDGADAFASEYKYVPIRRLALFIEESLYRGLKWVVFEPNDEPLWAQIRLNVGAFMHDLFRKGAFQGVKPTDAYFVKCDKETTTANDQNLGVVNIWVGFAPLKPAEFVVLYLQQIAQQLTT
jgi:phage tail sheath protein FI